MPRIHRLWIVFTLVFILGNQSVWADNPVIKLARGVENIVTSPLEYLLHYDLLNKEGKSLTVTALAGTAYGTFWTGERILGGLAEAVTFLIPRPAHYGPLQKPSTPIESLRAHSYFDAKK